MAIDLLRHYMDMLSTDTLSRSGSDDPYIVDHEQDQEQVAQEAAYTTDLRDRVVEAAREAGLYQTEHRPEPPVALGGGTIATASLTYHAAEDPYARHTSEIRHSHLSYLHDSIITQLQPRETHQRLWHEPSDVPSHVPYKPVTIVYLTQSGDSRRLVQETLPAEGGIDWGAFVEQCGVLRWCYFNDLTSEQPFIRRRV